MSKLKQLTLSSQISPVPCENLSSKMQQDVIEGLGWSPETITCNYSLIPRPKEEEEIVSGLSRSHMCVIVPDLYTC